tara:strand:+ start:2380 stop:2667 length:288 start_codon:yes stop_codon:yes gene_type:complete
MAITKDTILKIANLAKIEVTDDEIVKLHDEMTSIIKWVEMLNEVDTKHVQPMTNSLSGNLRMREDIINDGDKAKDILSNSPTDDQNFFVVPKVIE